MLAGGHGNAYGIHSASQRFQVGEHLRGEFGGNIASAFEVRIHDPNELHPFELAINAGMVASNIADANHGHSNAPVAHPDFAPDALSGSSCGASPFMSGAKACTAMPASLAASMSRG